MTNTVFEKADQLKDLNAQLVLNFEKLGKIIENLLWRQATEHGISPLQIQILLSIHYTKDALSASQLAKQFNLSKATISVALRPLEEKKMLLRKNSEKDGRIVHLHLTDWGKQIAHISGFYLEPLHQIVTPISNEEKEIILKNVKGILGKFEQE